MFDCEQLWWRPAVRASSVLTLCIIQSIKLGKINSHGFPMLKLFGGGLRACKEAGISSFLPANEAVIFFLPRCNL